MPCLFFCTRDNYIEKLHRAISENNIKYLRKFFESKHDVKRSISINEVLLDKRTFLSHAIIGNKEEVVAALLDLGADPNLSTEKSMPLVDAVKVGNLQIVQMLVYAGAKLEQESIYGYPLIISVQKQNFEITRFLVEAGANVNIQDALFFPLREACIRNDLAMVSFLATSGAKVNILVRSRSFEFHPIFFAIESRNIELLKLLLSFASEKISDSLASDLLAKAIETKNSKIVSVILGFRLGIANSTHLTQAIYIENLEIIKLIVSCGISIRVLDISPVFSVLSWTNTNLIQEAIEYFVSLGVNLDAKNLDGFSALEVAINLQSLLKIKILLLCGANPNQLSLEYIIDQSFDTIKLLLEGGLNYSESQLKLALYKKIALRLIEQEFNAGSFVLYDQSSSVFDLSTIPWPRDSGLFFPYIFQLIIEGRAFFQINIDDKVHKIHNLQTYVKLIDGFFSRAGEGGVVTEQEIKKIELFLGAVPMQRFSSPLMLYQHVTNLITDEVVGLHALYNRGILPQDVILYIEEFLVYDRYLSAIKECYDFGYVSLVYVSSILSYPFVDQKSLEFRNNIDFLASEHGQLNVQEHGIQGLVEIIASQRKEGVSFSESQSNQIYSITNSNQGVIPDLLMVAENQVHARTEETVKQFGSSSVALEWLNYFALKLFKRDEIARLERILSEHNIQISWHKAVFDKKECKKVKFKLHPDKGGSKSDFQDFVELTNSINDRMFSLQKQWISLISKASSITMKISDVVNIGVDSVKFSDTPSIILGFKILNNVVFLGAYGTGSSGAFEVASGIGFMRNVYEYGAESALYSALVSSIICKIANISPYFGLALSASIALYSLYNSAASAYHLLVDDTSKTLLSNVAKDGIVTLEENLANRDLSDGSYVGLYHFCKELASSFAENNHLTMVGDQDGARLVGSNDYVL